MIILLPVVEKEPSNAVATPADPSTAICIPASPHTEPQLNSVPFSIVAVFFTTADPSYAVIVYNALLV